MFRYFSALGLRPAKRSPPWNHECPLILCQTRCESASLTGIKAAFWQSLSSSESKSAAQVEFVSRRTHLAHDPTASALSASACRNPSSLLARALVARLARKPKGDPVSAFCWPRCWQNSSARLSIPCATATMAYMLADAASIIGIILLLAAAGGFIGVLLRHRSGSGCGCCCERLICPPKPSDDPSHKHVTDSSTPQQAENATRQSEQAE